MRAPIVTSRRLTDKRAKPADSMGPHGRWRTCAILTCIFVQYCTVTATSHSRCPGMNQILSERPFPFHRLKETMMSRRRVRYRIESETSSGRWTPDQPHGAVKLELPRHRVTAACLGCVLRARSDNQRGGDENGPIKKPGACRSSIGDDRIASRRHFPRSSCRHQSTTAGSAIEAKSESELLALQPREPQTTSRRSWTRQPGARCRQPFLAKEAVDGPCL